MERAEAKALGLKRYNTGRACRRGHTSDRLAPCGSCVECQKINHRADYVANAENYRVLQRARYAADPAKYRDVNKKWHDANPGYQKRWRDARPGYDAEVYARDPEKHRVRDKVWRDNNTEHVKAYRKARYHDPNRSEHKDTDKYLLKYPPKA